MMPAEETTLLAQLAAELQDQADVAGTVDAVVARAMDVVADAEHVSLTVRRRGGFVTLASTSPVATRADELQYALLEGPCVVAATDGEWFRSGDLGRDDRWPRWGAQTAALGVRSLMSVPLTARGERVGALNMYSSQIGQFNGAETLELALLYALHVAYAISAADRVAGLETALGTRHTIGMAQGILMERYGLSINHAFAVLHRASSTQNRKLREIAAELVETGRITGLGLDVAAGGDQ